MKKKNHTLRSFVIVTVVGLIVTWVLLVLGTILSGSLNNGKDVVPVSVGWFNEFGTYLAALLSLGEGTIWDFTHVYGDIIWYVVVVGTVLTFLIPFIIACAKKRGKYVFVSILNLVFCLGLAYAFVGFYYTNYLNEEYVAVGKLFNEFKDMLVFKTGSYNFGWAFYLYGIMVACLLTFIGIVGIFFTTLYRLFKKETVEVKEEVKVETAPSVATEPVAAAPVVEEPKKKGVLIIRRYNKFGANGPVIESHDTYDKPIAVKSLSAEEVRSVIRDELDRQEAFRLAEKYKQEKNAQMIAEAIVKATNANKVSEPAPKKECEETCACEKKEEKKEDKPIYPSPIVFAMPSSTRDEFYPKEEKKAPVKVEKKTKLSEDTVKSIISEEIAKALKDFVITKETIIQKPVEVTLPKAKEEEKPEEEETKPVEEVTTEEIKKEEVVVDETVKAEEPVAEKEVEVAPAYEEEAKEEAKEVAEEEKEVATEPVTVTEVSEPVVEETKVEEPTTETPETAEPVEETLVTTEVAPEEPATEESAPVEETPAAETISEEPKKEVLLTSNGTPKIIRIPFTTRMAAADDSLKAAYNEIKSLLKSYGLNNRVSNSGDSFRLHRVTYCKITIAGKSLKLYLALNPEDYADTTYPVKDASSKAIYKETPLVFKVKSGLSLRRGEELIRDCMDKHGLEQIDQVQLKDWASELQNAQVEDDGQDAEDDEE